MFKHKHNINNACLYCVQNSNANVKIILNKYDISSNISLYEGRKRKCRSIYTEVMISKKYRRFFLDWTQLCLQSSRRSSCRSRGNNGLVTNN